MNASQSRYLGGVAVIVAMLGGMLLLQDQRHGWPFSRHHGAPSELPNARAPRAPPDAAPSATRTTVEVDPSRLERIGVRFEPAQLATVAHPVRAVATVVADESRVSHVHTRVSGWIEELYINTTGQAVRAGEPLAAVFSQELFSSQLEYLSALRQAQDRPASAVLDAARMRLKVLGMTDAEIARVERTGEAMRLVTVTAPRSGTVLRRGVNAGTAVDPSTEIMTVADLSQVWVIAEIPESAAGQVTAGMAATLNFPGSGRPAFAARVDFVYPTLAERTRAARVRFVAANTDGRLPPGLYGNAELDLAPREVLTVGRDAVVDTGEAQHVFVRTAANVLEPRTVRTGARLGERIELLEGLSAGEEVVAAGVFLIDSESRLRASGTTGHAGHGAPAAAKATAGPQDTATSAHPDRGH